MELELQVSQKQVLSQRLQVSIQVLQMNAVDLDQYIRDAALENPLIELDMAREPEEDPLLVRMKKLEWLDQMDNSNTYHDASRSDDEEPSQPLYDKHADDSLYDVLLAQLPGFQLPEEKERVIRYVIGNLDENGYIAMSRQQLCCALGLDEEALEEALDVLHRMDPPGIGAENLRECLRIQAERMENPSPILLRIIDGHLDTLAKNQMDKLAKALHVSLDEVKAARKQLLTLNPKPGNGYSSTTSIPYIRPDFFVVSGEDGYTVILNDGNQPRIELNDYYRSLVRETDGDAAKYIKEKLGKAEWLVSCIQQRKSTMLKCAESILSRQIDFFEYGPGHLIPMTLTDVAGDLDMHPSTISRATRGKYLQCQWGVFALSDFFSRSVGDGMEESQDMVQNRIRHIIAGENPKKPFSDQAIADRLNQYGIHIARRTVAKYREQMNIPPASGRKKF